MDHRQSDERDQASQLPFHVTCAAAVRQALFCKTCLYDAGARKQVNTTYKQIKVTERSLTDAFAVVLQGVLRLGQAVQASCTTALAYPFAGCLYQRPSRSRQALAIQWSC